MSRRGGHSASGEIGRDGARPADVSSGSDRWNREEDDSPRIDIQRRTKREEKCAVEPCTKRGSKYAAGSRAGRRGKEAEAVRTERGGKCAARVMQFQIISYWSRPLLCCYVFVVWALPQSREGCRSTPPGHVAQLIRGACCVMWFMARPRAPELQGKCTPTAVVIR